MSVIINAIKQLKNANFLEKTHIFVAELAPHWLLILRIHQLKLMVTFDLTDVAKTLRMDKREKNRIWPQKQIRTTRVKIHVTVEPGDELLASLPLNAFFNTQRVIIAITSGFIATGISIFCTSQSGTKRCKTV